MPTDIRAVFAMLEDLQLRYVLVGGLALVLHGVDRLTADIDLAVDLAPDAAGRLIDIFTVPPIPFEDLWRDAVTIEISKGLAIRVASIPHLIRLKELAARPQDLADIERLRALLGE